MPPDFLPFILVGAGVVLAFDTIASLASLATGVPYSRFAIGSAAIYVVVGYMGASRFSSELAVAAAVAVGAVEATAGWWISARLGPGKPDPSLALTSGHYVQTSISVALFFAGGLGLLGAILAGVG